MKEKSLPSSLDAALAQVDPGRRQILAMLLAGVAAAPLLTSAALAAENKSGEQKAAAGTKEGTELKSDETVKNDMTVKHSESGAAIKSDKTVKSDMTVKQSERGAAIKSDMTVKHSEGGAAIKSDKTVKSEWIKGGSPEIKGEATPIKGTGKTVK
jgi:hypothetical protein